MLEKPVEMMLNGPKWIYATITERGSVVVGTAEVVSYGLRNDASDADRVSRLAEVTNYAWQVLPATPMKTLHHPSTRLLNGLKSGCF